MSCFACCQLIKGSIIAELLCVLLSFSVPATSTCTFSNVVSKKKTRRNYLEAHLEPSERQGLLDSLHSANQEPSNVTPSKPPLIRMMLRGPKFHKIPSSPSNTPNTNSHSAQPSGWRRRTAPARLQQASWWAIKECCRAEERSRAPTGPACIKCLTCHSVPGRAQLRGI